MSYAIEEIADALRTAREARGLSQRELSTKSGVPQSHISKIENGAVDLRLSSLVELSRVLDLELTLVPRKALSAVQAIIRSADGTSHDGNVAKQAGRELARLKNLVDELPKETVPGNEFDRYYRLLRELEHFRLSRSDLETIQSVRESLKIFKLHPEAWDTVRNSFAELQKLRNFIAHGRDGSEREVIRPAYSLEEDDHG